MGQFQSFDATAPRLLRNARFSVSNRDGSRLAGLDPPQRSAMRLNMSEPPAQKTTVERLETVSKIFANIDGLFVPVSVAYFAYVLNQSNLDRENATKTTEFILKYEDTFIKLDDQRRAAFIRSLQAVGSDPAVIRAFLAAASTADPSVKTDLQTLVDII
jgi:hypothetical protein